MAESTTSARSACRGGLAVLLAFCLTFLSVAPHPVRADLIATETSLGPGRLRAELVELLARAEIREELRRLGISPEESAARVAALSDAEIAALGESLRDLPTGGEVGNDDFRTGLLIGVAAGALATLLSMLRFLYVRMFE